MKFKLIINNEKLKERGQLIFLHIQHFLFIPLLLPVFWGCDRRAITYSLEAEVEVRVDWSTSGLDASDGDHGATALFYPEGGGPPKTVLMGNRSYEKTRLSAGRYKVIVFNRSFDDFSSVSFRGIAHCHTLEAYAGKTAVRGEEIVQSPEKLAADYVEEFEVTGDMLGNYNTAPRNDVMNGKVCSLLLVPGKLVEEMNVTVNIKGLRNVRAATATIDGVSASVFLAGGRPSEQTVAHRFSLGNPRYHPGSVTDGTMNATINGFTFNSDVPHNVKIKALLIDGKTIFEQTFEHVNIREKEDEQGNAMLVIEVDTKPIPDVKPEGGADSGFDAEVGEWGDEESGDLTI